MKGAMRMRTVRRPSLDVRAARVFQTATAAVGGLYLVTHSVAVTAIGTCAATAVTAWATWLNRRHDQTGTVTEREAIEMARAPEPPSRG